VSGRLAVLKGHKGWVNAVACFALAPHQTGGGGGGKSSYRIASASSDRTIRIWDAIKNSMGALAVLEHHRGAVWCLEAFSAGGVAWLASGSEDRSIRFWDPVTRKQVATIKKPTKSVKALATLSTKGGNSVLASGGEDNLLRIHKLADVFRY